MSFTKETSSVLALLAVSMLFAAGLCSTSTASQPAEDFKPTYLPTINIPRIDSEITIDGELDESVWLTAGRADGFCETSPGDQTGPAVESRALVCYDESNLYVALIAFDDPSTVRASYRDRDEIFRDDYFGIMLDTYGDAGWGYELFVNPYGVQGDLRMEGNGDEDVSFNLLWDSMGKVTDSGYQVEIAIPFASLRFPEVERHTWRINFWRDHQREVRRRYSWAAQDRDNPCFMCQWGYLRGLEGIESSTNLEIMPSLLATQYGALENRDDPDSRFSNADLEAEASVNVRYGLSSNSSVEFTYNPDFSQVESDADQIDVNTSFGLFFPESRPFFQEGGDLFRAWGDVIYTRSINDPLMAAKFTGQFNHTSVAYLFGRDENSPIMLPFQQQTIFARAEGSYSNILRAKHSFLEDSYVGMLITDRRFDDFGDNDQYGGGSGTVFEMEASVRFLRNYRIEMQALGCYTEEADAPDLIDTTVSTGRAQFDFDDGRHTVALDGEKYWGHTFYLSLERDGRRFSTDLDYLELSPTYRTANGFATQNDLRKLNAWAGLIFRPNRRWLISWQPSLSLGRCWNHSGKVDIFEYGDGAFDEWARFELSLETVHQTNLYLQYLNSQERYAGVLFPGISVGTIQVDSRFSEVLSGGFSYNEGRVIYRSRSNPEMGYRTNISAWANFKPTDRLFIQPDFDYSRMNHLDAYLEQNPDEEKEIFEGYILRTRLTYQFTRQWFLRLVVQYNDFSEQLDIEPLLTYKLNPFTKFYVGVSGEYNNYYPADGNSLTSSQWSLASRQVFAKVQYLFRI